MKMNWIKRVLSIMLTGALTVCMASAAAPAAGAHAEEGDGKYVSEVFIAYGEDEEEATEWLTKHGWEPVKGNFNAGKASFFDDNAVQDQDVAAVMGIHRTGNKEDAVTDMAVMNMTGGYSIPDYESLVEEKKTEIDEFINSFWPVIREYRANYNNEGSELGKKRADLAYSILNKFTDGGADEEAPKNDTGMKLGDLFLADTLQEGNKKGGDLQQLILESSGPAMTACEVLLVLGSDAGAETWLERASGLTGEALAENLPKYAPEAEGQDVAASAAAQFLGQHFGDSAAILAGQWSDIHEQMLRFETYNDENGLWPEDGEDAEAYETRVKKFFEDLKASDPDNYEETQSRYYGDSVLYENLYEIPYIGEWGETLGDFFNPADGNDYGTEESFLPMAAALSKGQRAAIDLVSLNTLLMIGFPNEESLDQAVPDIEGILKGAEGMSIYTGINRGAFRGGVAITSEALMTQNSGKGQAFDKLWDNTGIVAITSYVAAAIGALTLTAGAVMAVKGVETIKVAPALSATEMRSTELQIQYADQMIKRLSDKNMDTSFWVGEKARYQEQIAEKTYTKTTRMGVAGRWMMGVGGAILIGAAIVKGIQLYKYYQRKMKPIPRMIVDESDIVTYLTDEDGKPLLDENGNQKKNIDFKTYEYYSAVKCNRPDVGEIGDWQDGVKQYKSHNCYDIADLNADMGQEWLALYTVKSADKGDPILADTLTLKYGKNKDLPEGCTTGAHLFTYKNVLDLGDTAWAYNNKKNGIRLYWGEDKGAFAVTTASAFGAGQLALAAIGGLILGILGTTIAFRSKRRKKEESETV